MGNQELIDLSTFSFGKASSGEFSYFPLLLQTKSSAEYVDLLSSKGLCFPCFKELAKAGLNLIFHF